MVLEKLNITSWMRVMNELNSKSKNKNKHYITEISRKLNITYAHVYLIIKRFENKKLIKTKIEKRRRYITLTNKGQKLAVACSNLSEILK